MAILNPLPTETQIIRRPTGLDDHASSISSVLNGLRLKGEEGAALEKRRQDYITSIDYGSAIESAFVQKEIEQRYKDLPANQGIGNNINFLGSSFSGVDIKVVAHMYDEQNIKEERAEKTKFQRDTMKEVRDACQRLMQGGLNSLAVNAQGEHLTFGEKQQLFLTAAGLGLNLFAEDNGTANFTASGMTGEQEEASQVLLREIYQNESFSFLGVARMKMRTNEVWSRTESLLGALNDELERINSLEKVDTSSTIVLGTLQTISVQTFREKNAVRALGHTYAKGYTRGTRTIGGSCIFTIFDENALATLIRGMAASNTYGERDHELSTLIPDQLPPIDLTIVFANEYGALSDFRLYGVEFFTDGTVFSIEDLLSEETMNFVCRDADIMTSRGRISISRLQRGMHNGKDDKDVSGSSLLFNNQEYSNYLSRLGVRRRLLNR